MDGDLRVPADEDGHLAGLQHLDVVVLDERLAEHVAAVVPVRHGGDEVAVAGLKLGRLQIALLIQPLRIAVLGEAADQRHAQVAQPPDQDDGVGDRLADLLEGRHRLFEGLRLRQVQVAQHLVVEPGGMGVAHHAQARDAPDSARAVGDARPLLGGEGALDVGAVLVEQVVDRQCDLLVVAPVALEHVEPLVGRAQDQVELGAPVLGGRHVRIRHHADALGDVLLQAETDGDAAAVTC